MDPTQVLQTVVDDFGKSIDVGNQMDVVEYLLNFIERLEEGLGEAPKAKEVQSEASTQRDSIVDLDTSLDMSVGERVEGQAPPDFYNSYLQNTAPVDARPLQPKQFNEYTNKIGENFFGEQTMVTKLVNKEKGTERLISRIKERLGPIMLKLKHGNLTEDWQESARDQVDDYKVEKSKVIQSQMMNEVCINENWIR